MSVGLCVFNGDRYLAGAIESIRNQTEPNLELILCDNGSTDATSSICSDFAARDPRIRYHRHVKNLGAAANYRSAVDLARGAYFKWASHDDLCEPTLLQQCCRALDEHPEVVLAYAKTRLIDDDGVVTGDYDDRLQLDAARPSDRFEALYERLRLCNALYGVIRTETLRRTPMIASFIASDVVLLAELSLHGRFWEVPEYLFLRRFHQQSTIGYHDDQRLLQFFDTANRRRAAMTRWSHLRAQLSAVRRAPISVGEKLRTLRHIGRMARWDRKQLWLELVECFRPSHRDPSKSSG